MPDDQLDLIPKPRKWWQVDEPPRARASDPVTSHAAAESMVDGAAVQRQAIVDALQSWGPMNHSQIDAFLGWNAHTSNRRLVELRRAGAVERTGRKTLTASGRYAFEYRVTSPQ